MTDRDAGRPGKAEQRTCLVDHIVSEVCGGDHHGSAPEPKDVGKRHVGTNLYPRTSRGLHRPPHDVRVAGVKAAGDVDGRNVLHQLRVVTWMPPTGIVSSTMFDGSAPACSTRYAGRGLNSSLGPTNRQPIRSDVGESRQS